MTKKFEEDMIAAMNRQTTSNNNVATAIKNMDNRLSKIESGKIAKDGKTSSSYSSRRDSESFGSALSKMSKDDMFTTQLTDFVELAVNRYGGLIDYGSSELENRASVAIKLQAEKLTEFALDTERYIGSKSIQMIFGNANDARVALAEIYKENSYYLNRIAEDYAESEDAGLEAMANSLIIQKAMRINQKDFASIVENQMASSKKVTSQVFEEIAFFAGEYSNRTTASIFQITNNLTRAVGDFDTFGGASVENLGKLSGFMGQLKMDTGSVSGLIQKMQSFEGSVSIVRDLAGAFGAVIDPAKLMADSINDPAEALNTIRQSLLDAGHTSESLGFKITLLAKDLGVSSEAMRRFLNSEIDAQSVLENSVEKSGMTAERTSKIVSDAQKQMVDTRSVADNLLDIANTQMEAKLQKPLLNVRQFQTDINQFITSQGNTLDKIFGGETAAKAGTEFNNLLFGDDEQKAEAKKYLEGILDSDKLGAAGQKQAASLKSIIDGTHEDLNLDKLYEGIEKIKTERQKSLSFGVDIDESGIDAAMFRASKSAGVIKFQDEMKKPFDYTRTHSNSDYMNHLDENFNYLNALLNKTTAANQPLDKFQKKVKNMGVINVKLKDESGDMSLDEFSSKMEEINTGVNSIDKNSELIKEIKLLREDFKNTKYVANITNDGTYNVVLGEEFKTEVKSIAEKVVEETFKAAGLTA